MMHTFKKRIFKGSTKLLCLVLFAAMCLPMTLGLGLTVHASTTVSEWDATEIILSNEEDLMAFANEMANGNSFANTTVKLGTDIVLNTPEQIGSYDPVNKWPSLSEQAFSGIFDGQGYTISGLFLKATGDNAGMFGVATSDATVQNFALVDSHFESNSTGFGTLFGKISDGAIVTIDNVYVDANVVSTYMTSGWNTNLGGLVGWVDGAALKINSSVFAGKISGANASTRPIGGLVARIVNEGSLTITNTAFYGTIMGYANNVSGFVSIVGRDNTDTAVTPVPTVTISNCISMGQVTTNMGSWTDEWHGAFGAKWSASEEHIVENVIYTDTYYGTYEAMAYRLTDALVGRASDASDAINTVTEDKVRIEKADQEAWLGAVAMETVGGNSAMTDWSETATYPLPTALVGVAPSSVPTYLSADHSWYGTGSDTAFTLNDEADVLGFAQMLAQGNTFEGKTIYLAADVDLNPGWTADGTVPANLWPEMSGNTSTSSHTSKDADLGEFFIGTFDGQGHKISGIYAYSLRTCNYGLFGNVKYTKTAAVKNLTIDNSYMVTNQRKFGGLFGNVEGTATVSNVYLDIDIVSRHSSSDVSAYNGWGLVGAIAGDVCWGTLNVSDSVVTGDIYSYDSGMYGVGGFAGQVAGGSASATFTNCDFYGKVLSNGPWFAGFVGAAYLPVTFDGCVANGEVHRIGSMGGTNRGAFIGWTGSTITITDCVYNDYDLVGGQSDSSFGDTNKKITANATWVGYQTTSAYELEGAQVFDLRLLAVINDPTDTIEAYGFSISLDGVSKGNVRSKKISTSVTAYNGNSTEVISAASYGGTHFVYVHIIGVPADGTAAEFTVTPYTLSTDGTTVLDTAYAFTPSAFTAGN